MAGDSDLVNGDEEPALFGWVRWFFRIRMTSPFVFIPFVWALCRLLDLPCELRVLVLITCGGWVVNGFALLVFRRDGALLVKDRIRLERFVTALTLIDIFFITTAVHFAGGALGPLWPFVFIPVVQCAALLQSFRSLLVNSAVAIAATLVSAWPQPLHERIGLVLLTTQLAGFCAIIVASVKRGMVHQGQAAAQLESARSERRLAEAVAKRREEILSVVSHELASPLMTLRGYVQLLSESKSRDRDGQMLQRIERQVTRISALADDLLQMASSKIGALRLRRQLFDLVVALRELREGVGVLEREAHIEITGEASVVGTWDRDRIDQLFGNLVSNAVKFAGARTRITIDVQQEGPRHVHVRVHDDGPGISPEALARVFEPFQRYSSERGGLGLGLAIARSVTMLHEGRIWAESPNDERGRGATIHVVLPTDMKPSGEQRAVDDSDPEVDAFVRAAAGKQ